MRTTLRSPVIAGASVVAPLEYLAQESGRVFRAVPDDVRVHRDITYAALSHFF
ncbi:MAG: hypothetical protein AAFY78_22530 [Cyanobacteria bacterium J06648_16]